MIKRLLLYVVVLFVLLAVAVSAGQRGENVTLLQQHSEEISAWLTVQEKEATVWSDNNLGGARPPTQQPDAQFTVLVHRGDSLLYCSNTNTIPAPQDLRLIGERTGRSVVMLPMGWFLATVTPLGADTRTILIPIRYASYYNHLDESIAFPANAHISKNLHISTSPTTWPITLDSKELCWLYAEGAIQSGWTLWLTLSAWVLFFTTLLSVISLIARWLNERFGVFSGAALLVMTIGGLLYFNQQTNWTGAQFGTLPLFKQTFNNAPLLGHSVGDWLLHVLLLVYLMAFSHRSFLDKPLTGIPNPFKVAVAVLGNLLMMLGIPLCILVVHQMIFKSTFGLDFDNILSIGTAGFLSLTGIIGLMVGLFLFGHRLIRTVRSLELTLPIRLGTLAGAVILLGIFAVPMGLNPFYIAFFALIYGISMDIFAHWEGNGFGWVVVWLLLFSLFSSTILYRYNTEYDRIQRIAYARELSSERDTTSAERLLPAFMADILQDSGQISQILKPWPFKANIEAVRTRLNSIALQEPYIFQHYRLNVAAFDLESQPILLGQTLGYEEVVKEMWQRATPLPDLSDARYLTGADGKFRYILRFSVGRAVNTAQRVQVFVILEHEYPDPALAYTRIFYNSPYKNLHNLFRYNFAVQKNGRIVVEQGRGSLAALSSTLENGQTLDFETNTPHRVDAVDKSIDGKTIASVGHSLGGWLKQIYLFSLIFTLTALVLLSLALVNSWLGFLPETYDFRLTAKGSLARRIHLWNVSLLAASFLVVGFLTYRHFTGAAREAEQAAFDYRAEALQNTLEAPFLSMQDSSWENSPASIVGSLQKITTSLGMDANFFSPAGKLLFTTQKDLVSLGILPSQMSVTTHQSMVNDHLPKLDVREQVIGHQYFSQYRSCRTGRGELLGFLGVPQEPSQEKIGADVSDFIGMLASLYVFLLLIAYAITFVLARSIIRPLSLLSEKVQELKLEDNNAPLDYAGDAQDEISELIGQYNTMVQKLEDSKVQMVRLEREGAWREMAKQVAHDIKNPLTTMKLSMQQLERVSSNPEQAAAYLRKAITRLIEQIDSLAQIASEFSMFANLDIRQKNDVVINEVVESVHDLFSEQKNVALELTLPKEVFHILGDKNHLIRVFNNLVINAIQSIPSDRTGRVSVSLVRKGKLSVVQISDNGGGIPPEIRERVFEPNFTTKTSGSGLGLAICKKIIEAHDGNIRFETRENEGTDFFVEIPITSVN
jgi:signal transduction histidine kinase